MNTIDFQIKKRDSISKKASRYARQMAAMIVVAVWVLTSSMNCVEAAAGDLDPNFGNNGIAITDLGFSSIARRLLVQADGKLIVVGLGGPSGATGFLTARYTPNGSLDTAFGSGGYVIDNLGIGEQVVGAALDANGRIVIVGMVDIHSLVLIRYKPDGALDSTFGNGGKIVMPISQTIYISDMALQADGKIVAVGYIVNIITTSWDFLTMRFTTTGSLDTSFGDGGLVATDFSQPKDRAAAVLIQNDGKIVVAGTTNPESGGSFSFVNSDFCMARYNPDGSLDATFGTGGKRKSNFAVGTACGDAILQKDGKIILVGFAWDNQDDFALARYNANGSHDTTFGNSGLALTDFGAASYKSDQAFAAALQEDGKIVVAGGTHTSQDSALARYNANGTLDANFGTDGKVITDIDEFDSAIDVAIYGNGRIVTANSMQHGIPQPDGSIQVVSNFVMARYQDDGTPTSANLAVAMTDSLSGNLITYTITVDNYGPDASYYVTLKDNTPANTTFVSFTAPAGWVVLSRPGLGQTGTVSVSKSQLVVPHPPFTSTATFTLVVRLSAAASGTTINNRATVSSSFTPDPYAANDRAIVYTSIP